MKITVKQLRYILATNEAGSITDAAASMSVSQPTLSGAIGQVEKELGFNIFLRKGSGVAITPEGKEFLLYARRVVEEMDNLELRFGNKRPNKIRFNVVTQRLAFAEFSFINIIKQLDLDRYDFTISHEGSYAQIIKRVARDESDFGIFVVYDSEYRLIEEMAKENDLNVVKLFSRQPQALMAKTHPLANRESVTFKDLEKYPRIASDDTGIPTQDVLQSRIIHVSASMATQHFYRELDGYTVWCNLMPERLEKSIVGIPIKTKVSMIIGYVVPAGVSLNEAEKLYVEDLMKFSSK